MWTGSCCRLVSLAHWKQSRLDAEAWYACDILSVRAGPPFHACQVFTPNGSCISEDAPRAPDAMQLISQHYQSVTFPLWFHACRAAALGQLPPLKPVDPPDAQSFLTTTTTTTPLLRMRLRTCATCSRRCDSCSVTQDANCKLYYLHFFLSESRKPMSPTPRGPSRPDPTTPQ